MFKNHLKRSVKYSGRKIDEIIFDTYINPKIENFTFNEIKNLFHKNNLILYSTYYPVKNIINFLKPNAIQFRLKQNKSKKLQNKDIALSDFKDLTILSSSSTVTDLVNFNNLSLIFYIIDYF